MARKSATVTLTVVAAMGLARGQQRPDPCEAATFNESGCQGAIKNGFYCWQGTRIPMTYPSPYPYYYDLYQQHLSAGGAVSPAQIGSCGGHRWGFFGSHGASRGGFGSTCGSRHGAGA